MLENYLLSHIRSKAPKRKDPSQNETGLVPIFFRIELSDFYFLKVIGNSALVLSHPITI